MRNDRPTGAPTAADRAAAAVVADALEQLLAAISRRGHQLGADRALDLTTRQRFALTAIAEEGPMRLRALAARLGTTDATASRTVDALVRLGVAQRGPDPGDRRGVLVAATKEGHKVLQKRRQLLARALAPGLTDLDDAERERLVDQLRSLVEGLEASR